MPSIQSKAINVMLHLTRMKRTVNRMRQRVESGERTYTEPSQRHHRQHQISKREINGHLVWTIAPREKPSGKHVIYLHGGAYVNSFASQHWDLMSKLVQGSNCTVTAPNYPHAPEHNVHDVFALLLPLYNELAAVAGSSNITVRVILREAGSVWPSRSDCARMVWTSPAASFCCRRGLMRRSRIRRLLSLIRSIPFSESKVCSMVVRLTRATLIRRIIS